MNHTGITRNAIIALAGAAALGASAGTSLANPTVTRLTPPSKLFSNNNPNGPITARFLPGQRFDLAATISPDAAQTITSVAFYVDNVLVPGTPALTATNAAGLAPGTVQATLRAYSQTAPGVHTLTVIAQQSNAASAQANGNFEIAQINQRGKRARNVIVLIGDGMGIAHRTAARIMREGVTQGKADNLLAMDRMPNTGIVITHSLNSIVTDSSPGAHCYSTGNKANNSQHGVFPDDTNPVSGNGSKNFDNPRIETMPEYLHRVYGKSSGLVTTADVFDATPAAWASHTQSRSNGTGICDQYFDDRGLTGLSVLMGGGRKWFLPSTTSGSGRTNGTDYVLPADVVAGWGAAPGALDNTRNLLQDFVNDGWTYTPDAASLSAVSPSTTKLLGLYSLSNMNVAKDKIDGRRGATTVVNDFGFPNQPLLPEMTAKALQVLNNNPNGFMLMVEGASIDKQAHNMDTERWILDTIEFDDAVRVCQNFAAVNSDTLIIVTADHECAGINIIGASTVTDAALQARIATGAGAAQVRNGVVGTYDSAGFPRYVIAPDGYPTTTDVDYRMLIGYAANGDRYEDWRTNPLPLQDSQQPFVGVPPLNAYPAGPLNRDTTGNFLVTGQIADSVAAHTASDVPVSAQGRGASQFSGIMDNTDVFFKAMQAVIGGWPN